MNCLLPIYSFVFLILIVLGYCYMLAKLKHKANTMRNWMLAVTIIGGFTIYYMGYIMNVANTNSIAVKMILAIHSTAEMLFMKSDLGGISSDLKESQLYMFCFIVVHALAILLVVTTAISLFGRRLNAKIQLLFGFNKKCYIFFDTNEEAITLGEDLLKNNSRRLVIFVGGKASKNDMSMFDRIERIGAYYIDNDLSKNRMKDTLLFKHIVRCNSNLFFLSSDEDKNVSGVLHLFSLLKQLSPKRLKLAEEKINLYIRIDSEDISQIFEEVRKAESINLNYSVFSDAEIIAMQVVSKYNPVNYINTDTSKAVATEDFEVMIIGFGRNGRSILRKLIEHGQFIGSTFKATIVDSVINTKIGSFNATYPEISTNYNIETIEDYVGSLTFFNTLKERSNTLKQIVISLGSDAKNVKTAIEIDKILKSLGKTNIDIIIITRKNESYSYIDRSNDFHSIHCVGQNKNIFSEAIIVNESLYAQAEATHNFYNQQKVPAKQKVWRELENIKQQSNISASNHITTKLTLMGLTVEQVKNMKSRDEFISYVRSDAGRYENLAKTEHLRWNASYFVRGWCKWSLANIEGDENQDHKHKLHACLVNWNEIDAVSKRFNNEPYKQYDFDNTDQIYELVVNDLVCKK